MNDFKRAVARTPILGRVLLFVPRARVALRYVRGPMLNVAKWLFKSKETTRFTYDLAEDNKRYLTSLIADVLGQEFSTIRAYIEEVEGDEELQRHIAEIVGDSDFGLGEGAVRFGRRIGWYAFARALKPRTIVETGVDRGLGSCVLTAALRKNSQEGFAGKYFGTDINPKAGYLLAGKYADFGTILYGDSIESLEGLEGTIDLFINDSDHSAEYEAREYATVARKLSEHAVLLGDNSHVTCKLLDFSIETGRHFVFFQEKPAGHWYPGAGIGISFRR